MFEKLQVYTSPTLNGGAFTSVPQATSSHTPSIVITPVISIAPLQRDKSRTWSPDAWHGVPNVLSAHCRRDPFFLLTTGSDASTTVTTQSCVQQRITSSTLTRLYRHPSSPRTPAVRPAYSIAAGDVCILRGSTGHSLRRCLAPFKNCFSLLNPEFATHDADDSIFET